MGNARADAVQVEVEHLGELRDCDLNSGLAVGGSEVEVGAQVVDEAFVGFGRVVAHEVE
ncbi:hypothetical protein [Rhodococcus sp. SMB37]|uniref:hypothetical protein n=1 Tax=Rhodococcus sp. SMB37 TaxID=2512213 RepID=UPI0013051D19|nr:hypothetical protein [Rhodococcus sp. SMB37]